MYDKEGTRFLRHLPEDYSERKAQMQASGLTASDYLCLLNREIVDDLSTGETVSDYALDMCRERKALELAGFITPDIKSAQFTIYDGGKVGLTDNDAIYWNDDCILVASNNSAHMINDNYSFLGGLNSHEYRGCRFDEYGCPVGGMTGFPGMRKPDFKVDVHDKVFVDTLHRLGWPKSTIYGCESFDDIVNARESDSYLKSLADSRIPFSASREERISKAKTIQADVAKNGISVAPGFGKKRTYAGEHGFSGTYRDIRSGSTGQSPEFDASARKMLTEMAGLFRADASDVKQSKNVSVGVPLIAVWNDSDVRYNKDGTPKGAYIDVQVDQSNLTEQEMKSGKGYGNPSISRVYAGLKGGKPVSEFYTQRQLDMMTGVGTTVDYGSKHGCSFTANVYTRVNEETGKSKSFVCLPKDEAKAKDARDLKSIQWYNDVNKVSGSCHDNFSQDDLKRQVYVTNYSSAVELSKERSKARSADLKSAFSHKDSKPTEQESVFVPA